MSVGRLRRVFDDGSFETSDGRLANVVAGLRDSPPRISPIWFYDARGSALFERICEQPEYYLTRTEIGIMREHAAQMARALGPKVALIEPGSGASLKTRLLLDALVAPAVYAPVDISREPLFHAAERLQRDYPRLHVHPICADFTAWFAVPAATLRGSNRNVVYFPGSTLGNFDRNDAVALLSRFASIAGPNGAVLLGLDSVKDASILERAYDDAAGMTAAFNLNALRHLNRALRTTFDLSAFGHRARWVPSHARIEMHLVATRDTRFEAGEDAFALKRGDYLLTEYSHKYTAESAAQLACEAGLDVVQTWSDARGWFRVMLLEPGRQSHTL